MTRSFARWWFVLLLPALFLLADRARAEVVLVRDGQALSAIVLAEEPTAQEKLAAEELALYLGKMSGAEVPITSERPAAGTRVLIGTYGQAPVQDWQGQRPPHDGFAIETRPRAEGGDEVLVVGGDARGALYGVYELLERFLGVRWYMPGEVGEHVPPRRTVELPALRHANAPDFSAIGGLVWAGGPGAAEWERRNKAAVGPPNYFFGHNWEEMIPPRLRDEHPEWFALNPDGTRSHQLCSTHPDVIRTSIEKAREFFEKNPEATLYSLSPNDGHNFCTCERCKAIDGQYGVTDGSETDRFIHYANEVLEELGKTHPDKLVGILAYVSHTRPPVSARPHPNYATMICHTPWEFCHVHAIDAADCERNARFREMIEGWTKVCRHVSVYDYYGHFYIFAPWPIVRNIRQELPYLKRIGVQGFMSETQQHWANQGMNFYLAAKLAWDTDRDADALLADYYEGFYGPAAAPMRRYWLAWESAMARQPCGGYRWLAMFTPELLAQAGAHLDAAERLAVGDERVSQRLALHRTGFRFTEAFTAMRQHAAAERWQEALDAGEEAIAIVKATEGTVPQPFWIYLAEVQTQGQMRPYREKLEAAAGQEAQP